MSDTPRTDAAICRYDHPAWPGGREFTVNEKPVVLTEFARTLERELAAAIRERDNALSDWRQADTDSIRAIHERNEARAELSALKSKFTKLDKPKYSGAPMMDSVLATRNPEFDEWVASLPPTYWTRYDLSAARIGWEAAKKCNPIASFESDEKSVARMQSEG